MTVCTVIVFLRLTSDCFPRFITLNWLCKRNRLISILWSQIVWLSILIDYFNYSIDQYRILSSNIDISISSSMIDFDRFVTPRKIWFCCLGKYALEHTRISLHIQEVFRGSKREMSASEISKYREFKYVTCKLKIHLDPLMANSTSTTDFPNEVTHGLRLDDCNIQIKFERLKRRMSVCH